jgi:Xaa-Pro aminopeptidase
MGKSVHECSSSQCSAKGNYYPFFVNEPLAVFPEEDLGVRVEDTILITDSGCEFLSAGMPRTVKEIEKFVKKDSIPQVLKKSKLY